MIFWAKYNTQTTFSFPIVKRGVVDLAVSADWTPATGDTKVSKDQGNVANTSNNPAATGGTGSALWNLTLTATELSAAEVVVQIVDAATKAIEDQCFTIYTYGNASAKVAFDFSVATQPVNLTQIDGNATTGNNATLNLKQLNVVNNAGTAIVATSTGSNGYGLLATGNGTGSGLGGAGGATGRGMDLAGGGTSGQGLRIQAAAGNSNGMVVIGVGSGAGISVAAGATGDGMVIAGGGTSGHGIDVLTTSGDGLHLAPTAGHGISAVGNGTSKHGIQTTGGTAGTSDGINAVAGTGGVPIRGDLTGNVTGNLSGSVGSLTTNNDKTGYALTTLESFALHSGTAQAGAAGSITLAAGASATDNLYKGEVIKIYGGAGAGQARIITAYNGTTKVATVGRNWATAPDNTSTYAVLALSVPVVDDNLAVTVGGYSTGQAPLQPTVAGRTLDVSTGGEAGLDWANIGSPTTTVNLSGTSTKALEPTTAGRTLDVASTGEAGLDFDNIKDATGAHTLTNIRVPNVTLTDTVTTYTGNTVQTGDAYARLGAPAGASTAADIAAVKSDTGTLTTRLSAVRAGYLDNLSAGAAALEASVQSVLSKLLKYVQLLVRKDAAIATDNATELTAINASGGSGAGAFANTTDALEALRDRGDAAWTTGTTPPTAGAIADAVWDETLSDHLTSGSTGAALNSAGSAGDPWGTALPGAYGAGTAGNILGNNLNTPVSSRLATSGYTAPDNTTIGTISTKLGTPSTTVSGDLATIAGYVDTEVSAIKAKTDNLPASPAAVGSAMTLTSGERTAIANALWDLVDAIEAGMTPREALRLVTAAEGGKVRGMATTTVTIRNAVADDTDRITATVDADGNRTALTYNLA